jgi:hypothetical protein
VWNWYVLLDILKIHGTLNASAKKKVNLKGDATLFDDNGSLL